jgi:hypothetical protein
MASPSRGGGSDWEGLELNDGGESVPLDRHSSSSRNGGGRGGSAAAPEEDDDASSVSSDGGTPLRDLPGGAAAAARAGRSTSSGGGRLRGSPSPSPSPVARDYSMGNYGDAQVTQRPLFVHFPDEQHPTLYQDRLGTTVTENAHQTARTRLVVSHNAQQWRSVALSIDSLRETISPGSSARSPTTRPSHPPMPSMHISSRENYGSSSSSGSATRSRATRGGGDVGRSTVGSRGGSKVPDMKSSSSSSSSSPKRWIDTNETLRKMLKEGKLNERGERKVIEDRAERQVRRDPPDRYARIARSFFFFFLFPELFAFRFWLLCI